MALKPYLGAASSEVQLEKRKKNRNAHQNVPGERGNFGKRNLAGFSSLAASGGRRGGG